MRVLATGTDGYIGALLGPYLMQRGIEVVGLDTGFYRQGWLYPAQGDRPLTLSRDIRSIEAADLAGFDAVAHLAELSNDPLGKQNPGLTHEINHGGSLRLANAARKAGVKRFVYTSSCSIYGVGAGGDFVNEDTPANPQTAYAECKALVERDVGAMAGEDFAPCFLRNATAYGASPRQRFDIVLNDLCGLAWTTKEIKLLSDGTPWRPLVHALDICQAIYLALKAPEERIRGEIFNVGSTEQNYRVIDIAKIVAAEFPGCTLSVGEPGADNRSYRVNFDKIQRLLPDYKCQWTAESGARQMHRLFQQIQMTGEEFRAPPFTRLNMLMKLKAAGALDEQLYWRPDEAVAQPAA
ncbi:MAG: NAD-dependent epimerase/dehydratase family protein [Hyphomonadaceae bacterium]